MTLKTGKLPATYDSRDIRYADIRPKGVNIPVVPLSWTRGGDFTDWGMKGNGPQDADDPLPAEWTIAAQQGAGDCTCADPTHAEMMNAHDAGNTPVQISAKTTVQSYMTLTELANGPGKGYDPTTGANDTGLECRFVLDYRQKTGWIDDKGVLHQIGPYVSIEPGNWQHLREACWLFPGLTIGVTLDQAQEDQFNAGQNWQYTPGSTVLGGHDVIIVGHPGPGLWDVITWGKKQTVTYQFLTKQCDEIWAYTDMERISAVTCKTYNNYSEVDLAEYITTMSATVS